MTSQPREPIVIQPADYAMLVEMRGQLRRKLIDVVPDEMRLEETQ
jgi:hypothetical protein